MRVVAVPVKRHFWVVLLAFVALAAYGVVRFATYKASPAQRLSAIYFYDKSENKVSLDAFKGKVVLVNLWATWCTPCIAELPSLDRLQEKFPAEKFQVVAIAMDRSSIAALQKFMKKQHVKNLAVYWDKDKQVPLKWKYEGLPTSYLLNQQGNVIKRYDGAYKWDSEPLLKEIKALLP